MVEALVVGAGPAGALSALILARAGVRVLVVDRAVFPRDKLCGDTLNPGALALLDRHGLGEAVRARGRVIEGMLVTGALAARGPVVQVRGLYGDGVTGRSLIRRELDQLLIDAAVRAGAQFQDDVRVAAPIVGESSGVARVRGGTLLTRDGRTLRVPALVTIAADGRRSSLAFALGLARQPAWPRRWAIGGYMEQVEGVGTVGEMHIRGDHYLGVAPLPGGLTNVCCVLPRHQPLGDPARVLATRLAADPLLRDRVVRARLTGPVTMLGPLAVDVPVAGMPGLLLAGDAAGFVDPMTGDGLRFALRGAELAADVAMACIEEADPTGLPSVEGHTRLTQWRARELAGKYRVNRAMRALVGSRAGVRVGAAAAWLAPAVLRAIIRYAGDVAGTEGSEVHGFADSRKRA